VGASLADALSAHATNNADAQDHLSTPLRIPRLAPSLNPPIDAVDVTGYCRCEAEKQTMKSTAAKRAWSSAAGTAVVAAAVAGRLVLHAAPPDAQGTVTFARDIAPILQRSCQNCHRPDGVAPMSLVTYEEVRPFVRAIRQRTSIGPHRGVMPPWYIEKNVGIQKYKNDPSLADAEVAMIGKWVDNGAPLGNPADMPPAKRFVYRGAGAAVTFEPRQIKVWEDTREGANSPWAPRWIAPPMPPDGTCAATVTFDQPGTYVLRARADDGALTTDEDVTVTMSR
jgi:hypothetical protein